MHHFNLKKIVSGDNNFVFVNGLTPSSVSFIMIGTLTE